MHGRSLFSYAYSESYIINFCIWQKIINFGSWVRTVQISLTNMKRRRKSDREEVSPLGGASRGGWGGGSGWSRPRPETEGDTGKVEHLGVGLSEMSNAIWKPEKSEESGLTVPKPLRAKLVFGAGIQWPIKVGKSKATVWLVCERL